MSAITGTATGTLTTYTAVYSGSEADDASESVFVFVGGLVLLFFLLVGMAASVDITLFTQLLRKPLPIGVGLVCQVLVLPALAYAAVSAFGYSTVVSTALLTTCMTPGGAYSNLVCSLLNADLALSIAMTTTSTMLSLATLPLNMYLYIELIYDANVQLNWASLVQSVGAAAAGLWVGLLVSWKRPQWRRYANILGTLSGVGLMVFGLLASTSVCGDVCAPAPSYLIVLVHYHAQTQKAPIWNRPYRFYIMIAFPILTGIIASNVLCKVAGLRKQQAVAIVVECGYQNTALGLSMMIASFRGDAQGVAMGVPLCYAGVQTVVLLLYCTVAWKLGYTYAPPSTPFLKMLTGNFQPTSDAGTASELPPECTSPGGTVPAAEDGHPLVDATELDEPESPYQAASLA